MKKPSLLDRLTNAVSADDPYDDLFEDEHEVDHGTQHSVQSPVSRPSHQDPSYRPQEQVIHKPSPDTTPEFESWEDPSVAESDELAVDVYQTKDHIVVKALVSGVLPNNLDIGLTRDTVTIKGTREEEREVEEDNYFHRELYWGHFSRSILLPEEVDVDNAEASEKHGVLVMRLPKINKARATKLKVKTR